MSQREDPDKEALTVQELNLRPSKPYLDALPLKLTNNFLAHMGPRQGKLHSSYCFHNEKNCRIDATD